MSQALPSGTVTFLFTDLEGSTRLWEQHGEAMRAALVRHDAALTHAVEAANGVVVKHTGDGIMAAFASAHDAVRAAIAAQHALAAHTGIPFAVRMGIHTGVIEPQGGDYFGPTLNRAARVMAIGHGGQVLVSQATEQLVRDALDDDIVLHDLGEHRLRDLLRPERVFQVGASGLPADFPDLRSLDALPGNLPSQLTSFVGRERELAALAEALRASRLVTIVGVGGVGKTRVALQAAAELLPEYPEGAWVCELAAATDGASVDQIVGSALGVAPGAGVSLRETIVEFLRNKSLLLVLDNCEHVLDTACHLSADVLHASRNVRVLATSREPLGTDGEYIFPLRSLPIDGDALRLFDDRAGAVRSGFVVDATNTEPVAEICRRLDGIPLAIELAAARVVSMSPREIAALLDERFRLLTGGRRSSLERHQTLRATVEWSYGLLGPKERVVFDRLAVFSDLDGSAARAVVADDEVDEWAVIDALDGLVRKSMLTVNEQEDGSTRYQMLETLRQYAREQLDRRDELDLWRRRHAQFFAAFAEEVGPALLERDELTARPRLYAELDNLRAAATWALDTDDPDDAELGVRMLAALAEDQCMNRRTNVGLPPASRALAWARRSTPGRRAAVLASAAYEAFARFDSEQGVALGHEALQDGMPADCPTPYRVYFAVATDGATGMPAATPLLEEAMRTLDANGTPPAERARVCTLLTDAALRGGQFEAAAIHMERALELARESQNPSTLSQVLYHVGAIAAADDPDAAIIAYTESIALSRAGAHDATLGAALFQRALLIARRGEHQQALVDLREAIILLHELALRPHALIGALAYAMEMFTVVGSYDAAAVLVGAARSGALTAIRQMPTPREARERGSGVLREYLSPEEFDACVARGAGMPFDELVAWVLDVLHRRIVEMSTPSP